MLHKKLRVSKWFVCLRLAKAKELVGGGDRWRSRLFVKWYQHDSEKFKVHHRLKGKKKMMMMRHLSVNHWQIIKYTFLCSWLDAIKTHSHTHIPVLSTVDERDKKKKKKIGKYKSTICVDNILFRSIEKSS